MKNLLLVFILLQFFTFEGFSQNNQPAIKLIYFHGGDDYKIETTINGVKKFKYFEKDPFGNQDEFLELFYGALPLGTKIDVEITFYEKNPRPVLKKSIIVDWEKETDRGSYGGGFKIQYIQVSEGELASLKEKQKIDDATNKKITLYQHHKYEGKSKPCRFGNYSNMGIASFPDNEVSSIKIDDGIAVIIYSEPNYKGESKRLDKSTDWVGDYWNDRISSFKMIPK